MLTTISIQNKDIQGAFSINNNNLMLCAINDIFPNVSFDISGVLFLVRFVYFNHHHHHHHIE
ncbi:hypothetical protein DERP_005656 [Dermatophagoides pteronyssinus]|uniref:Uncharacterized protein n=1 Tax=Dermatophagoides pteronyssinus TaxID=6956 RepID=A0ABQ8J963_DERPT|nr:hypothetical protein DERP_005656 [Dermatophagoides pteronyssinus]